MNEIKVTLISKSFGNEMFLEPEQIVAVGKRICNSAELLEVLTNDENIKKTDWRNLQTLKSKHMGVLEHILFTFLIEGVSRVMTHQLVRHRMASYLQMSQRTVPMENLDIIIPPSIKGTIYESRFKELKNQTTELYNDMTSGGIDEGDARYIMPHGMETRIWMTINARSLCHFLKERLINPRAQWEIKEVARQMYELAHMVCPTLINLETSEYWE